MAGDNVDYCGSLACYGGMSGECVRDATGPWANQRVDCGVPSWVKFEDILNPVEESRSYSSFQTGQTSMLGSDAGWETEAKLDEWVSLDLGMAVELVGVAVQKKLDAPEHSVTSYEVSFQQTTGGRIHHATAADGGRTFSGPMPSTPKQHMVLAYFKAPVFAHIITVKPTSWVGVDSGATTFGLRVGVLVKQRKRYQDIPGLNSEKCDGMLRDPTHLFRRMWAAEAWSKQTPAQPKCWQRDREGFGRRAQPAHKYFDDIVDGSICNTNWFEVGVDVLRHTSGLADCWSSPHDRDTCPHLPRSCALRCTCTLFVSLAYTPAALHPRSSHYTCLNEVAGKRTPHACAQGNRGDIGFANQPPTFTYDAPAVLGFDESIDAYCIDRVKQEQKAHQHGIRCVEANVNILSLYGVSQHHQDALRMPPHLFPCPSGGE